MSEPNRTCRFVPQTPILPEQLQTEKERGILQVADVDKDQQLDFIRIRPISSVVDLFLGYNNNSFQAHQQHHYQPDELDRVDELLVADLNNDDHLDLIFQYFSRQQLEISYGFGNGSFHQPTPLPTAELSQSSKILFGDLNNDTYSDIIIFLSVEKQIIVHLGKSDGRFSASPDNVMDATVGSAAASLADFNDDGVLDLVYAGGQGQFVVAFGLGNGSFHSERIFSASSPNYFVTIFPCDLNEDGLTDLVLAGVAAIQPVVMLNRGHGTFWSAFYSPENFLQHILDMKIGNLNDDNHLDMAIIHFHKKIMKIHMGFGNGSFAAALDVPLSVNSYPSTLEMKDFNGDHRLDLFSSFAGDEFVVVLNDC